MAEYIERTEELILAVNAGARAIEQSRRFCGATYVRDVFSDHPQEIPYVTAAKVLRGVDALPAADVVEVVRCKDCKWKGKLRFCSYDCCTNPNYGMASGVELREDDFCSYGEREG